VPKYSKFDIKVAIKTLIRILKKEEPHNHQEEFLTLKSNVTGNKNSDLIENGRLNSLPSMPSILEIQSKSHNFNITFLEDEESIHIPTEIISEEQRLIQVMLCVLMKLTKITIRAQITIESEFQNGMLKITLKERGNISHNEQEKL